MKDTATAFPTRDGTNHTTASNLSGQRQRAARHGGRWSIPYSNGCVYEDDPAFSYLLVHPQQENAAERQTAEET